MELAQQPGVELSDAFALPIPSIITPGDTVSIKGGVTAGVGTPGGTVVLEKGSTYLVEITGTIGTDQIVETISVRAR